MAISPAPPPQAGTAARDVELVRFIGALSAAESLEQLERRFVAGFARVLDARMYGYDLADPCSGRPSWFTSANVSDAFVARYVREAWALDPVRAHAARTGRPAYNLALMTPGEWEESAVYASAFRIHRICHLIAAPIMSAGRVLGTLHVAQSDPDRGFGSEELALAEALAVVLGETVERLRAGEQVERERDEALAALDLTATAVVVSDPDAAELRTNAAARRLMGEVDGAEDGLYRLLARPVSDGPFSRRIDVVLLRGGTGVLHAASAPMGPGGRGLVAVLDLQREQPAIAPAALAGLTPREAEVAVLVADGLADREIAERLYLSHHTVSQYVKRIYRRLDVDSRVALTRLLLGRSGTVRAAAP